MIKTVAAFLLGGALACGATLLGTRSAIQDAAASGSYFPRVDTKGDRALVANRLASALCKHEGQSGGFVTMSADMPVFTGPDSPTPRGIMTHYELRATCSGGPDGPLKSDATVPAHQ